MLVVFFLRLRTSQRFSYIVLKVLAKMIRQNKEIKNDIGKKGVTFHYL